MLFGGKDVAGGEDHIKETAAGALAARNKCPKCTSKCNASKSQKQELELLWPVVHWARHIEPAKDAPERVRIANSKCHDEFCNEYVKSTKSSIPKIHSQNLLLLKGFASFNKAIELAMTMTR